MYLASYQLEAGSVSRSYSQAVRIVQVLRPTRHPCSVILQLQLQSRTMQSKPFSFRKTIRAIITGSSTRSNQPVCQYFHLFSVTSSHQSALRSWYTQSRLIGANRWRWCSRDELDRDLSRCPEGGKLSGGEDTLYFPDRGSPAPSNHHARCKCPITLQIILHAN